MRLCILRITSCVTACYEHPDEQERSFDEKSVEGTAKQEGDHFTFKPVVIESKKTEFKNFKADERII